MGSSLSSFGPQVLCCEGQNNCSHFAATREQLRAAQGRVVLANEFCIAEGREERDREKLGPQSYYFSHQIDLS